MKYQPWQYAYAQWFAEYSEEYFKERGWKVPTTEEEWNAFIELQMFDWDEEDGDCQLFKAGWDRAIKWVETDLIFKKLSDV